jgi:hypothetical protein
MSEQMHEMLRRLFDVILSEAEQNPELARKLAQAIGQEHDGRPRPAKAAARKAFDPSEFHAINILRLHGEPALRGKLEQVKAVADLKSVARASGLVLSGSAGRARASRTELILGIIEAAKHYDAQRRAATAPELTSSNGG